MTSFSVDCADTEKDIYRRTLFKQCEFIKSLINNDNNKTDINNSVFNIKPNWYTSDIYFKVLEKKLPTSGNGEIINDDQVDFNSYIERYVKDQNFSANDTKLFYNSVYLAPYLVHAFHGSNCHNIDKNVDLTQYENCQNIINDLLELPQSFPTSHMTIKYLKKEKHCKIKKIKNEIEFEYVYSRDRNKLNDEDVDNQSNKTHIFKSGDKVGVPASNSVTETNGTSSNDKSAVKIDSDSERAKETFQKKRKFESEAPVCTSSAPKSNANTSKIKALSFEELLTIQQSSNKRKKL